MRGPGVASDQDLRHVVSREHPELRHRQGAGKLVGGQQGIAEHEYQRADGDGRRFRRGERALDLEDSSATLRDPQLGMREMIFSLGE